MIHTARGGQVSLGAHDFRIGAKPVLVRFEDSVERVLRCGDQLDCGILFTESGLEIGVGFSNFTHGGVTRAGELVLGAAPHTRVLDQALARSTLLSFDLAAARPADAAGARRRGRRRVGALDRKSVV